MSAYCLQSARQNTEQLQLENDQTDRHTTGGTECNVQTTASTQYDTGTVHNSVHDVHSLSLWLPCTFSIYEFNPMKLYRSVDAN